MIINNNNINQQIYFIGKKKVNNFFYSQKKNHANNLLFTTLFALSTLTPITLNSKTINTSAEQNYTIQDKNDSILKSKAKILNLAQTANRNIYFNNEKQTYYQWDNKKNEFKKSKNISEVYKTGYIKTKKGEYLSPKGNLYIKKDYGTTLIPTWGRYKDLGQALAVVNGYKQSDIAKDLYKLNISNNQQLELYYDDETKKYLRWNDGDKKFEPSNVTEVIGEYYSIGDKRFKIDYSGTTSSVREANEEEYQVNKSGLIKIKNYNGIYTDKEDWYEDRVLYYWNNKTSELIPFGDKIDIQKMLTEKVDGKIGDFRQGDMGDCWLLASINGMLHHPNPILREKFKSELKKCWSINDNSDITVHLKGVNKNYTFTKEDIDSVLIKSNHYSIGDREVVAIEMGMEKYLRTLQNGNLSRKQISNFYNLKIPPATNDSELALDGGTVATAIHLLTGKETHFVQKTYYDDIILEDGKYKKGYLDEEFLSDKLKNNMVFVSYRELGDDYAHVVSLYGIDEDVVYIVDSNIDEFEQDKKVHPIAIPKPKFFSELIDVTYSDLKKNLSPEKTKPIKMNYSASDEVKKLYPDFRLK